MSSLELRLVEPLTMMQEAIHNPDEEDGAFQCPRCHSHDFGVWAFPHPLIVHWVLNPGLMVNELVLGQRIPKITYYCKRCGSETTGLRYYQCPGCDRFHEEAIWTGANGFGHWLGVICPDCATEIPCVLNIASWIVLARLSPINWSLRQLVGERYLRWEQRRAQKSRDELVASTEPVELATEDSPQIDPLTPTADEPSN